VQLRQHLVEALAHVRQMVWSPLNNQEVLALIREWELLAVANVALGRSAIQSMAAFLDPTDRGTVETSASFKAFYAPRSYPTLRDIIYGKCTFSRYLETRIFRWSPKHSVEIP
jgi:hypothetical protein